MKYAPSNLRLSTECSPRRQHGRRPSVQADRRIVWGRQDFGRLIEMLRRDPDLRICLVESTWDRVDAARARADAAGVDDRLVVHHAAALQLARAG